MIVCVCRGWNEEKIASITEAEFYETIRCGACEEQYKEIINDVAKE